MAEPHDVIAAISADLDEAEAKAWDSLARYKFWMFGYWAAIWVHQNRAGRFRRPNPFVSLVTLARQRAGRVEAPAALRAA